MTTKQALHELIDQLPEQDLPTAEAFLEFLFTRSDPLLRLLKSAPEDDEPTSSGDIAALETAWQEHLRGETIPADVARRRLLDDE